MSPIQVENILNTDNPEEREMSSEIKIILCLSNLGEFTCIFSKKLG